MGSKAGTFQVGTRIFFNNRVERITDINDRSVDGDRGWRVMWDGDTESSGLGSEVFPNIFLEKEANPNVIP